MRSRTLLVVAMLTLVVAATLMVACGGDGGRQSGSAEPAFVNVSLSDPPTCASPAGPYSHVYVTIADVQIHQSSTANANDAGWVSLTPALKSAPKQVDLLGLGGSGCLLAQLGSNTQIQAGTYQQIRVYLAADSVNVPGNQCAQGNNCVVYNGQTYKLNLSSETQTGIKIPAGQIAGGQFVINPGEVRGLNIDFDACASIVTQGAGGFRLKPVLHAGEVSLSATSITGTIVDSGTQEPLLGVKAIVSLQQKDASGVDRVVMQTTPDATGNFIFCPVPAGTYDVVSVAVGVAGASANVAYAPTVTTGVQPGNALGKVPLIAQTGANTQQASITGAVSTTNNNTGAAADVTVSALQTISVNGSNVLFVVPLAQQQSSSVTVTTEAGAACAAGTNCASYTLAVPAMQPNVGAFAAAGTTYTQSTATPVTYTVDALAYAPNSGATPMCNPSEVKVATLQGGGVLAVAPGVTVSATEASFTGCQ